VNRKTKNINFILSTIGRADIAPNIPTALSGVVAKDLQFEEFLKDTKTVDAVIRNFEIIGEAANKTT
jgi:uncharacterized protein with HEPN domain